MILGRENVPVERIRLARTTVTGRATVRNEVRKERIVTSVDGDASAADPAVTPGGRTRRSGGRLRGRTAVRGQAVPSDDQADRIVTNTPDPLLKGKNTRR